MNALSFTRMRAEMLRRQVCTPRARRNIVVTCEWFDAVVWVQNCPMFELSDIYIYIKYGTYSLSNYSEERSKVRFESMSRSWPLIFKLCDRTNNGEGGLEIKSWNVLLLSLLFSHGVIFPAVKLLDYSKSFWNDCFRHA